MKQLTKKTFITIFIILSSFLILSLIIFNVQSYSREYESFKRNLNLINENKKETPLNDSSNKEAPPEIDNMRIMDFEVYTIILSDNSVDRIISHGN